MKAYEIKVLKDKSIKVTIRGQDFKDLDANFLICMLELGIIKLTADKIAEILKEKFT